MKSHLRGKLFLSFFFVYLGCDSDATNNDSSPDAAVVDLSSADHKTGQTDTAVDVSSDLNTEEKDAGASLPFCDSWCTWKVKCGNQPDRPTCLAACEAKPEFDVDNWRPEFIQASSECLAQNTCTDSEEDCFVAGWKAVDPDYGTSNSVSASCLARRSECSGNSFGDDYCFMYIQLVDSRREEMDDCLDKACAEIRDCLKTLFPD